MKYYDNSNETNIGPVSPEDLIQLERAGMIDGDTRVAEQEGSTWRCRRELYQSQFMKDIDEISGEDVPNLKKVFLSILRNLITQALRRIFFIPTSIPKSASGQLRVLNQLAGPVSLASWLSTFIIMYKLCENNLIAFLFFSLIVGFVSQYCVTYLYQATNGMIFKEKRNLLITTNKLTQVSAARVFWGNLRMIVRGMAITLQVLTPFIMVIGVIIFISTRGIDANDLKDHPIPECFWLRMPKLVGLSLIATPYYAWFSYGIISLIPDFADFLLSFGEARYSR